MAPSDSRDPNVIPFAPDRRRTDDPYISELLKGLLSSFKDLERKNRELEERNAELLSSLQQASEKIARLEESSPAGPEPARAAFRMAAEMLQCAEEKANSVTLAARAEIGDRYESVTRRIMDLQNETISLLRQVREENALRREEASEKAIDVLMGSRRAILSMMDSLEDLAPDWNLARFDGAATRPIGQGDSPASSRNSERVASSPFDRSVAPQEEGSGGDADTVSQSAPLLLTRSVELVTSPFSTFGAILAFQRALQRLPGIVDVKAESFDRGTLQLRVRCHISVPIQEQLLQLARFDLRLVSATADRIEASILQSA